MARCFTVGDKVRIRDEVLTAQGHKWLCPKPNDSARIERFYGNIVCGVYLDKKLHGFRSWNIADLEPVKKRRS